MGSAYRFFLKLERWLHPKIKEGIAKSLVYYFTIKEMREYRKPRYRGQTHLFDPFDRLIRVAHRGFSGLYPENTLLAFRQALAQAADIVELDVQLSGDGEIVVCHDPHLGRLTGHDMYIRDLPYAELRSLDMGAWKDPAYAGQHLPTLAEVFTDLPPETRIMIEVKHEATRFLNWDIEKALVQTIKVNGWSERVVLGAFNPMVVNRIRKLAPELSTIYLITQTLNPLLIFLLGRICPRYLAVDMRYLKPRIMDALRRKQIRVLGYTLNTPADYQVGCELGLVGLITDFPDRLRAFLTQPPGITQKNKENQTHADAIQD